jgi:hypothetical protein
MANFKLTETLEVLGGITGPVAIAEASFSDFIAVGGIPATAGAMRLGNTDTLQWRNVGNTGDIAALQVTAADHTMLNALTGQQVQMAINNVAGFWLAGAARDAFLAPGSLTMGSTASSTGDLRVQTSWIMTARNAADDGDITLLDIVGGTDIWSIGPTAAGVRVVVPLEVGTAPYATVGEIRLGNNSAITMRNEGNTLDVTVLSMISTDIIEHGQGSTLRQNIYGRVIVQPTTASDGSLTIETGTGTPSAFSVRNVNGTFFAVGTGDGTEVVQINTPNGLVLGGDSGVAGHATRTLVHAIFNSGVLASGTTFTFSSAIPAGARLISVTARVGSAIVGPTSWDLGIAGGDIDRWGATLAIAGSTQVGIVDYTNTGVFEQDLFPVATDILVTANGGAFTAGTIGIAVTYETITPPAN